MWYKVYILWERVQANTNIVTMFSLVSFILWGRVQANTNIVTKLSLVRADMLLQLYHNIEEKRYITTLENYVILRNCQNIGTMLKMKLYHNVHRTFKWTSSQHWDNAGTNFVKALRQHWCISCGKRWLCSFGMKVGNYACDIYKLYPTWSDIDQDFTLCKSHLMIYELYLAWE